MDRQEFLERVDRISVWKRTGERAPHKPLLLLYALAQFQRGNTSVSFNDSQGPLKKLLVEFGPNRQSNHPEYPFWYLRSDKLWEVSSNAPMIPRTGKSNPPAHELKSKQAVGYLPPEIQDLLRLHPELVREAALTLLEAQWPGTLHPDIVEAVGLDLEATLGSPTSPHKAPRDPAFRDMVLTAYEQACGLCGFSLALFGKHIAVEAAHIRWHSAGGPAVHSNGIALCPTHHKLFDLGAFTLRDDHRVLVSEQIADRLGVPFLAGFHGKVLHLPHHPDYRPAPDFLAWHRIEVFKPKPRYLAS